MAVSIHTRSGNINIVSRNINPQAQWLSLYIRPVATLTLIWVGSLGSVLLPLSKTRQNYAGNLKLARKYTYICRFKKYIFQCQGPLNFAVASIFLQKISFFWQKWYLYSKQQCESCVKDFLVMFSVFVRQKVTVNENVRFTDCASGIRLLDCSKLAINWKNDNDCTICQHHVIVKFF